MYHHETNMNVAEILNGNNDEKSLSFEVLPPLKGMGTKKLFDTIDKLKEFCPKYINITTHHSEYVYKELENGLLERQRVRRRPGTIAMYGCHSAALPYTRAASCHLQWCHCRGYRI